MSEREWRRLKACVEQWPECVDGKYNPACCRFPKECSCLAPVEETPEEWLEPVSEFSMSVLIGSVEHPIPGAPPAVPAPRPPTAEADLLPRALLSDEFACLRAELTAGYVSAGHAYPWLVATVEGLQAEVARLTADLAATGRQRDAAYRVAKRLAIYQPWTGTPHGQPDPAWRRRSGDIWPGETEWQPMTSDEVAVLDAIRDNHDA